MEIKYCGRSFDLRIFPDQPFFELALEQLGISTIYRDQMDLLRISGVLARTQADIDLIFAGYLSGCPSPLAQLCIAMLEPQPSNVAGAPIRSSERIRAWIGLLVLLMRQFNVGSYDPTHTGPRGAGFVGSPRSDIANYRDLGG